MDDYFDWAKSTVKPFGINITSKDSFLDGKAFLALLCSLSKDQKTFDKFALETAKTIKTYVYKVCTEQNLFTEGNARIPEDKFMEREVDSDVVHMFIVMIRTIQHNRDRAMVDSIGLWCT